MRAGGWSVAVFAVQVVLVAACGSADPVNAAATAICEAIDSEPSDEVAFADFERAVASERRAGLDEEALLAAVDDHCGRAVLAITSATSESAEQQSEIESEPQPQPEQEPQPELEAEAEPEHDWASEAEYLDDLLASTEAVTEVYAITMNAMGEYRTSDAQEIVEVVEAGREAFRSIHAFFDGRTPPARFERAQELFLDYLMLVDEAWGTSVEGLETDSVALFGEGAIMLNEAGETLDAALSALGG